jgi:hypothetical protein
MHWTGSSRGCPVPIDRSHAPRGNASPDALRPLWDAERPRLHSHAERGNDQVSGVILVGKFEYAVYQFVDA